MPEWTAEVIWSVSGAALVSLLIGWAIARFGGSRVARADYERTVAEERSARHELTAARARARHLEDELATLVATLAERVVERPEAPRPEPSVDPAGPPDPTPTRDPGPPNRAVRDAAPPLRSPHQPGSDSVAFRQLEGMNASLLDELEAARRRFARLHGSQAGLSAELEQVRRRVDELEAQNRALGSDLVASTRRVDELDELQSRIDRHLGQAREQVARFEARTGAQADELLQARARVGEVEATLQLAVAALQDTRSELDALGIDLRTPLAADETRPPADETPLPAEQTPSPADETPVPAEESTVAMAVNGSIDLTDADPSPGLGETAPAEPIDLRDERSAVDAAADAADADAERRSGRIETWRA